MIKFFIDGIWNLEPVRVGTVSIEPELVDDAMERLTLTLPNRYEDMRNGDLIFYSEQQDCSLRIDGANAVKFFSIIGLPFNNFSQESIRDLYFRRRGPRLEHKP